MEFRPQRRKKKKYKEFSPQSYHVRAIRNDLSTSDCCKKHCVMNFNVNTVLNTRKKNIGFYTLSNNLKKKNGKRYTTRNKENRPVFARKSMSSFLFQKLDSLKTNDPK